MTRLLRLSLFVLPMLLASPALAQLETVRVSAATYALVGPLGNRTAENLGNNATFGVIVTPDGVVLIDPGGTRKGAAMIDAKIREITDLPVRIVINSGGQDHRWIGNSYWAEKGARIIASNDAVADQRDRESLQLTGLDALVGTKGLEGTEPMVAPETFDAALDITLGGIRIDIRHPGGAHTPGDSFVWVPSEKTVFTGDIVYVDRLLGVIPVSDTQSWLAAFKAIAALSPEHLVPGHGAPTDLLRARAETYDYLVNLRTRMAEHIDAGGDIIGSVEVDQSAFSHLANYDILARRNAQAVFEAMEWE